MALEAKLNIGDGPEYDVINCEYEISQPMKESRASGRPDGGIITFTILSQDDTNTIFHEWMVDNTQHKNGSIVFSAVKDAKISTKTLAFEKAHCLGLQEHFNKHVDNEMVMRVTIRASVVKFGDGSVKFTNGYSA